jgi:hypothetical protein
MDAAVGIDPNTLAQRTRLTVLALNNLPDHCALDLSELARRIGADKLELITWARSDMHLARLIASKVSSTHSQDSEIRNG